MLADPEMRALAEEELPRLRAALPEAEAACNWRFCPRDEADARPAMNRDSRPGTGGEEAALFAGRSSADVYAPCRGTGLRLEIVDLQETELGGVKESDRARRGRGRLCPAEIRKRRASGAACAGNGIGRSHPHLGGDGGGVLPRVAEGGRYRHPRKRHPHRHDARLGGRRAAC